MNEPALDEVRPTFEAAAHFGLSEEEIWGAVREVADDVPPETPAADCLEQLCDALAQRIEEKAPSG